MRQRKIKTTIVLSCFILLVIVLHSVGVLERPERWLRALVTPGSRVLYGVQVRIGEETESFDSVDELSDAYRKMKEQYVDATVDSVALALLQEENALLREQLAYVSSSAFAHVGAQVTADVVGKNIEPLGTTLVLQRGSADGIAEGNPVIVGKGTLVGKIVRVEEDIAIVRLLTDNQSKIAATVMNKDKSIGVIEGGYDVSIRMNFIPQNERVTVGDTIITSGLEPGIPRGLLIGTVDVVQRETYQAFQQAVVSPFAEFKRIRLVQVLTNAP